MRDNSPAIITFDGCLWWWWWEKRRRTLSQIKNQQTFSTKNGFKGNIHVWSINEGWPKDQIPQYTAIWFAVSWGLREKDDGRGVQMVLNTELGLVEDPLRSVWRRLPVWRWLPVCSRNRDLQELCQSLTCWFPMGSIKTKTVPVTSWRRSGMTLLSSTRRLMAILPWASFVDRHGVPNWRMIRASLGASDLDWVSASKSLSVEVQAQ